MSKPKFTGAGEAAIKKFLGQGTDEASNAPNEIVSISQSNTDVAKPEVKQKRYIDKYRMTLILEDEAKAYLDIMIRLDGISPTQFINNLI